MLPLGAEVKRHFVYRIAEQGRRVLYAGAEKGSSRRSKLSVEDQNREYAVLNYLEDGAAAKVAALRVGDGREQGAARWMVRKKWLVREAVAEERDAGAMERGGLERVAESLVREGTATEAEREPDAILAELAAVGGRMRVQDLRDAEPGAGFDAGDAGEARAGGA